MFNVLIMSKITEHYIPAEETDDSKTCKLEFIEIVPLTTDTDGPCTTECDSGEDWSGEVKQENLAVVKLEPDQVCCVVYPCCYCTT